MGYLQGDTRKCSSQTTVTAIMPFITDRLSMVEIGTNILKYYMTIANLMALVRVLTFEKLSDLSSSNL